MRMVSEHGVIVRWPIKGNDEESWSVPSMSLLLKIPWAVPVWLFSFQEAVKVPRVDFRPRLIVPVMVPFSFDMSL